MFSASTKAASGNVAATTDPQFNYVTMLLHGDGTNGAQNNTFLDSSSNNLTITKNGSVNQGSFSPYGSNWSNYLNGASGAGGGPYLSVPNSSTMQLGSGNFTIEAWCYFTAIQESTIIARYPFDSTNNEWTFQTGSTLIPTFLYTTTGGNTATGSVGVAYSLLQNTWYHIAVVRNSGTLTMYINGTSVATSSISGSIYSGTTTTTVGSYAQSLYPSGYGVPNGYLSNVRVVKGTAVYTSDFTPSTTPLTAISGTSLLTCQSNRFIDNSTNNFAVTINSAPSIQRFNPFGTATQYSTATIGGSGYSSSGSSNYLYAPASSNFQYTGDFCVEAWVYTDNGGPFWGTGGGGSNDQIYVFGPVTGIYYDGTTFAPFSQASQVLYSTWTHVCLTRQSGVLRMIVNGILNGTKSNSSTLGSNSVTPGIFTRQPGSGDGYIGYLCDLRVSNGSVPTSYQTSSTTAGAVIFTPPTSPVTTTSQGANSSNVKLLVNFTNGAIFDNAMMNNLETVGNAQISTSVVKYGTGSMSFDGTGDWLRSPDNLGIAFGSGNFTVEGWIYLNNVSATKGIIFGNGNNSFGFRVGQGFGGNVNGLNIARSGILDLEYCAFTFATGTWYHIAVVRSGTTIYFFVNGIQQTTQGSGGGSYNFATPTSGFFFGANNDGNENFNGYIDDFRITKGYARYTANFTPPTAAFFNTGPY